MSFEISSTSGRTDRGALRCRSRAVSTSRSRPDRDVSTPEPPASRRVASRSPSPRSCVLRRVRPARRDRGRAARVRDTARRRRALVVRRLRGRPTRAPRTASTAAPSCAQSLRLSDPRHIVPGARTRADESPGRCKDQSGRAPTEALRREPDRAAGSHRKAFTSSWCNRPRSRAGNGRAGALYAPMAW